jgi:hypothetical protein
MKKGAVHPRRIPFRSAFLTGIVMVFLVNGGAAVAQVAGMQDGGVGAQAPDPKVLSIPGRITTRLRRTPARGLELLADYLREPGNDPITVKRYHDWLALNHRLDPNQSVPPGRSPYFLLTGGSGSSEAFARVLKALLDRSGIENVLVDGITKRYVGGSGEPLPWMWNAVRLRGGWRLVDAAMDAEPSYRASPGRPEAAYSGEYLFPDPEGFSFSHLPVDDRFLLTGRRMSRGEFLDRPLYSPAFALYDLEIVNEGGFPLTPSGRVWEPLPWEGVYRWGDRYVTATDSIDFLVRKSERLEIAAILTDRFGVRRPGRVLVHEDEDGSWVEIAPNEPGDHTATLYVREASSGEPWTRIYTFSVASDEPGDRAFPRSGLVYRHHGFYEHGLEITAASVPAPSNDPVECYVRITLPPGYEADGFFTDLETGEELSSRVSASYAGTEEMVFRYFPPDEGRYRGGITLMRTRGRNLPETVLEFYLDVWEPAEVDRGIDPGAGDDGAGGPSRPGYPGTAENLLLSRSFHREGLIVETFDGFDPDTGYATLSVRVPDTFFEEGRFLDCDAVDEEGENADFHAAYHRSAEGYRFFFVPAADRDLSGRIILRRRDPENGSFRAEQVAARLTLPRRQAAAAPPAPLPPADILAHQNGEYLGGTAVVRENITNRFVEGFVEITVSHPPEAELFVWYRDAAGNDYSRDNLAVSIPASGERSFRFRHPRFDPAVARIMIRSETTGGEFLPAYEFTVLPGLRTTDSLPPAGTLHFYPAFSRNGLVLVDEELRAPVGGRYGVEIRTPERYGLVAEILDGLGRRVDGAVHLRIEGNTYLFSFDPPPAWREYTVTLYLTDRFGSRIPVALFKLS